MGRSVNMANATLNKVIDDFRKLPWTRRSMSLTLSKQMTEAKSRSDFRRAKRATLNLRRGTVKKGTVKDLYKDLELDD